MKMPGVRRDGCAGTGCACGTCGAGRIVPFVPGGGTSTPGGWAGHYQGGPIGYAQREFEIAPGHGGSRWPAVPVEPGHAIAWNPSLPGGAKAEDTYLVRSSGMERVTTGRPGAGGPAWPVEDGDDVVPPRPAVLEVGV